MFTALADKVGATGSSAIPFQADRTPGFVSKLFEIFSDGTHGGVCSWGRDGTTILIQGINDFEQKVLPGYFKHNNYTSFVRQLNMYDFHKTVANPQIAEFHHPHFVRGRPDLLQFIKRKAPIRGGGPVLPSAPSANMNDGKVGPGGGLASLSILAEASFAADDADSHVVEAATRRHNTRKRHSGSDRIGSSAINGEFSRPTQVPERPLNHPRGGSFGGSLTGHGGSGDNGTFDASSMSYGDLTHLLGSNSMAWPVSQISALSAMENPHLPNGFLLQPQNNQGGGNGAVGALSSYFAGIDGHPQPPMQYRVQPQPPQEEKLSTLASTNMPPAVAAAMVGLESECRSLRAEQSALKHQLASVLQTQAETAQRLDHFLGLVSRAYGPAGGAEPRVGGGGPTSGGGGVPHEALLAATAAAAQVAQPDLLACARLSGGAAGDRSESENDDEGASDDGEDEQEEEGNGRSRSGKRQRVGSKQSDDEDEESDREGSEGSDDGKRNDEERDAEEVGYSSEHNSGDGGYDELQRRDRHGEAANENATFSPITSPGTSMPTSKSYFGQAWSSPLN